MPRPLYQSVNPDSRTRTTILRDAETGLPIIRRTQDTQPILDANTRDAAAFERRPSNAMGLRHIARIPMVVVQQLQQLGIMQGLSIVDERAFLQFLSDSQVRKLRADNGARLA